MNRKTQNPRGIYMFVLRIGAIATSFALWYVSVKFSMGGFNIQVSDLAWMGFVLAMSGTWLQLIFNRGVANNPTLFVGGILAYAYGITTNVIGILHAQNIISTVFIQFSVNDIPNLLFAIILACVIEIVPEALLLWSMFPENENFGDFVSSIIGGTSVKPSTRQKPNNSYRYNPKASKKRKK